MDALKDFVSSSRHKSKHFQSGISNKSLSMCDVRIDMPSTLKLSESRVETTVASSKPTQVFESSGSDRQSRKNIHPDCSTIVRDIITGRVPIPSTLMLNDYDLQVVFQYLRELGEPCTLYGETDIHKLERCIHSAEFPSVKKLRVGHRSSGGPVSNEAIEDYDWGTDTWIADLGIEVINSVKNWLRNSLKTWQISLPNAERELLLFRSTRDDIEVYMRNWKSDEFNKEMLRLIVCISEAVSNRDFKLANEKYMELSIGNVAWPIGVGNWAIQERAADDRIGTPGHALNDEVTRRFIQAIKRLITRAENMKI